jgi:hypothetical protein
MAASTGGQLFMTCKRYAAKEASWDDVMAAAKKHKPTYDNAEVSDDIYEDDNVYSLTDLKDFVFLPISSKEKKILRDYFNQ